MPAAAAYEGSGKGDGGSCGGRDRGASVDKATMVSIGAQPVGMHTAGMMPMRIKSAMLAVAEVSILFSFLCFNFQIFSN